MYPFWDPVVAPLVALSRANRIVEIGALRGETTAKMLGDLGPEAELHVIDPLPQFDPAEHEAMFPGRYVFHRDLSLNVLPDAGPFDVAIIDGDHNWYTVYHELQHLRRAARAADAPLPLLILHDVAWPYGRRDLYYEPSQIPEEFRQPYDRRGMTPGRTTLLGGGGMNITLANALEEGGERNGVRTALDDFVAEHDRPVRQVILPIYYGLAIAAEDAYLDAHPEVAEFLDDLESPRGTEEMLELSERIRLDEVVFSHNIERMRGNRLDRAIERNLTLLRSTLNNEHYVENEDRISYLLQCALRNQPVDPESLRDPSTARADFVRKIKQRKEQGAPGDSGRNRSLAYTAMGRRRLEHLDAALRTATSDTDAGDLVEVGCERGGASIYMRGFLDILEIDDRSVWVVDEFRAAPRDGARPLAESGLEDLLSDINQVREGFRRFGLLDDRVRFLQGDPGNTLLDPALGSVALLHIGPSVDAAAALDAVYDRVEAGGVVIVDGPDAVSATAAFRDARHIVEIERLDGTGVAWQKVEAANPAAPAASARPTYPPLAPTIDDAALDLSVVVVFHNMRREAERTLHSLTRTYQRDLGDLAYEVIAVDNGSRDDQRLGAEFVESFGPEFRYLDLGPDAPPSPTVALNRGIAISRGANVALMIDGAHLLTPRVLTYAMSALRAYEPTIVATQQWYLGPGQQPDVVGKGYDQAQEDALFRAIEWPSDGYRVFEIGHFIGERDWFDGVIESNCLFVPREMLEQVGGFDDDFSMPGGGYANLELLERLGSQPGAAMTTIIGEGSFHQVHGGTTTNEGERDARRELTFAYGQHYADKFGRGLKGPAKHLNYIGGFHTAAARRSRARRMTAMRFGRGRRQAGIDGVPTEPEVIPDELAVSFIDAFWHNLAWKEASWLGTTVPRAPTDLFTYQELLTRIRPDHVILTTDGGDGPATFLAAVCELLDHGSVIVVCPEGSDTIDHPRVTTIATDDRESAVAAIRDLTGPDGHGFVILGSGENAERLRADFDRFETFVRPGSYVILENTILNGRPVWPAYGPGPHEAVRKITQARGDFMQDTEVEHYALTFNRGGFLRRIG